MQAYVATPRNHGTVLGGHGLRARGDDEEDEEGESGRAVPIFEPTVLSPSAAPRLQGALQREVDGEDPFPGYPFMARTFANDNPGATARILLVDGVLFRAMEDFDGLTEGNPPTYVDRGRQPPERSRADIREMRRLARDTRGRYYVSRTPRGIERALQAIESRLRCDIEADDAFEEIEPGESVELAETEIDEDAHTADVRLSWRDRRAGFEVARLEVVRGGNVVRRFGPSAIARAYGARTDSTAALTGGRGRTFRALHLRGVASGGRLRVVVRVQRGKRAGRVYGRVTQSRRRR
jgi:hypothetical protein